VALFLRERHTLHEHPLGGIYTIDEIVSHMMLIPVNNESHSRSVSSYYINEKQQLIQHIDIVVRFDNSKNA
jgi:hypothetical protein